MNLPNKLTTLRILLVPVLILFMELSQLPYNYLYACIIYIIASVTDFLDGFIARKYNLVTDFGKTFDPLADKLLTTTAFVYMVAMEYTAPLVLIIILFRDFAVTQLRGTAATHGRVIAAGFSGKLKTALQMVFTILWFIGLFAEQLGVILPTQEAIPYLMWMIAAVSLYSGIDYLYKGREFLKG